MSNKASALGNNTQYTGIRQQIKKPAAVITMVKSKK